MKPIRRSAAELVAFHFGSDITDIRDAVYQPTRYSGPSVFTVADGYWCAVPDAKSVPKASAAFRDWSWTPVAAYYGWTVFLGSPRDS